MRIGRVVVGTLVAVVLAGGGITAAKAVKHDIEADQACAAVRSYVATTGLMVHASTGSPKVVILGDSYTAGDKLDHRADGWAYRIGKSEGWDTTVAGVGGTGFTDPGYCGEHIYGSRIDAAVATKPELLIIQGGLNDADMSGPDIRKAADAVLDAAAGVGRVVIVGPTKTPAIPDIAHVEQALSDSAKAHKRQYISVSGWTLPLLPDELHMTDQGHAQFAERVAEALR